MSLRPIYELAQNYNNLYDLLNDEEIPVEVVEEALKEIEDDLETKFENTAKLIKNFEGIAEIIKAEEDRLAKRRRTINNKIRRIKDYLIEQLTIMERNKIEAGTFVVRKQRNPKSVEVFNIKQLDDKFLIQQEPKPDTRAIKQALDSGEEVKGATYKPESYHLRIQ